MVNDLIAAARAYLGVRFQHQGRTQWGVDCVGLIVCAFRDIGIELVDQVGYSRTPFQNELEKASESQFIRVTDKQPGDMFLMSFGEKPISHAALYTGRNIIHSYAEPGRVIEQPFRDGRPAKLRMIMRYPWKL